MKGGSASLLCLAGFRCTTSVTDSELTGLRREGRDPTIAAMKSPSIHICQVGSSLALLSWPEFHFFDSAFGVTPLRTT